MTDHRHLDELLRARDGDAGCAAGEDDPRRLRRDRTGRARTRHACIRAPRSTCELSRLPGRSRRPARGGPAVLATSARIAAADQWRSGKTRPAGLRHYSATGPSRMHTRSIPMRPSTRPTPDPGGCCRSTSGGRARSRGRARRSAPRSGRSRSTVRAWSGRINIDGDDQADRAAHGGEHRAVFVYQIESYRYWERQLAARRLHLRPVR